MYVFDDFCKLFSTHFGVLHFEKSSKNLAKKEEKSIVQLAYYKPISPFALSTPKTTLVWGKYRYPHMPAFSFFAFSFAKILFAKTLFVKTKK